MADTTDQTTPATKTDPRDERKPRAGSYGTHTLPAEFWTSGKPSVLKDPEFRSRRAAKNVRTDQNRPSHIK